MSDPISHPWGEGPSARPRSPRAYRGEDLGPSPHVAVVFRDQIGDFVVATPLLRGLRERFPDLALDYFGGERTRELEEASRLIDARYSLFGAPEALDQLTAFLARRRAAAGPYALAINLESHPLAAEACGFIEPRYFCGPCFDPRSSQPLPLPAQGIDGLWHDTWNRADLLADYPELSSQFIAEIFCRLARVETDFARMEAPASAPPFPTPPVLISTGASRAAKLWPAEYWLGLAQWLRGQGNDVGLLGAAPADQAETYHAEEVDAGLIASGVMDLRGRLTLPEVAGALGRARAFVTIDNGLMHLAAAVGAPTIALFGASPRRLWAPPVPWVRVLDPAEPCLLCEENRFRNNGCLISVHQCMLSIPPERVVAELSQMLD